MKFYIKPKAPFNFELVASLYGRFPTQCVDLYGQGMYTRALKPGKEVCLIKVKSIGTVNQPKLEVDVQLEIKDADLVKKTVEWITGADEDISSFYKIGLKDEKFSRLIKQLYGLRPPRTPTAFEALIIAITEQQIALPVAITLRKRLVEKLGEQITVDGKIYFTFPTAEALAQAKPEEIRELKFSSKKSEYLVEVSQKVASGEIDLEEMKNWEIEKIIERLTQIRGIGPWTAEYMIVRGMGRYEALPAADIGLRSSLTKFLERKERVTEEEVRKFLEPFGKYKGNAAFYLICAYAFEKYPQERLV